MPTGELLGVVGGVLSLLVTIVLALVAVIYRNDRTVSDAEKNRIENRISALEKQNTEQETRIATLTANTIYHDTAMNRLALSIDKLDDKIDQLTHALSQYLGRRITPSPIPRTDK